MTAYVEPLDTYADMDHLIKRESWPTEARVEHLAYFCGVIDDQPGDTQKSVNERARCQRGRLRGERRQAHLAGQRRPRRRVRLEPARRARGKGTGAVRLAVLARELPEDRALRDHAEGQRQVPAGRGRVRLREPHPRGGLGQDGAGRGLRGGGGHVRHAGLPGDLRSAGARSSARTRAGSAAPPPRPAWPPTSSTGASPPVRHPSIATTRRSTASSSRPTTSAWSALCDKVFATPSNGRVVVRPLGSHVMLSFGAVEKIKPQLEPWCRMGFAREEQAAIWVPVVALRGDGMLPSLGWFVPYMWVDNPLSLAGGREIYGFNKNQGLHRAARRGRRRSAQGARVRRQLRGRRPRRLEAT